MEILDFINYYVLSPVLCAAVAVCGCYFTVRLRLYSPKTVIKLVRRGCRPAGSGGISPLSALSVALAGTLGVGNIAGVAVAISLGGPGAVFWMAVSALLGIPLKYCEAYLAVKFRGGAPEYIKRIAGKTPAAIHAALCIAMSFTSGSFIQMNAASTALNLAYGVPKIAVGVIFACFCAVIVFGGVRRVSAFTSAAMPLFCAVFFGISLVAVFMKIEYVPSVFASVIKGAFGFRAAGGGVSGAVFAAALRHGMTKGVFSHEAGCGTSAFSHGASSASDPAAQGVMGMAEVVFDTLVFGTLTALVILLSPYGASDAYDGTSVSISAYSYFFGAAATHTITVMTVFFAAGTVICWAYYGCEAALFAGAADRGKKIYLALYCVSLAIGSVAAPRVMWEVSDVICALLLALNCRCLLRGRSEISTN